MTRGPVSWIGAGVGSVLVGAGGSEWRAAGEGAGFQAGSVKPCDPDVDAGGARGGARPSPNRLFVPCVFHALPSTMDSLALFLDSILDRQVTNGTGLKGVFDIRLECSPEGTIPAVDP